MSKYREVEDFLSGGEQEEEPGNSLIIPQKKRRGIGKEWNREAVFDTETEALSALDTEECWSVQQRKKTTEGEKNFFYCNEAGLKCPASVYILLHAENFKASIFRSPSAHGNHLLEVTRGISQEIRKIIVELYEDGIRKPKQILSSLRSREVSVPSRAQLYTFLVAYRRKKYGPASINVGDLYKLCSSKNMIPDEMDTPFVVSFNVAADVGEDPDLKFFFSTRRLLKMALMADNVHCDATYKLTWQGYPVFVIGSTDKNRSFHPFGIGVCYGESSDDFQFIFESVKNGVKQVTGEEYKPKILVADAASAITKGFRKVFGEEFRRVMCWFHVKMNVEKRILKVSTEIRMELLSDISQLQLCQSDPEFDRASLLFLQKWRLETRNGVESFLQYFQDQWLDKYRFWYEGASPAPITNNPVEGTNGDIKKTYTFRDLLPLSEFISLLEMRLLPDWSREQDITQRNSKPFALTPTRSLRIWTEAFQWASTRPKLLSHDNEDGERIFYVASSSYMKKDGPITEELIEEYRNEMNSCSSFEDFKRLRTSLWTISMKEEDWETSVCNCPVFFKKFLCKHSLGLAIRLRLTKAPAEASTVPLGQKRGRGRPKKAKAALIR